MWTLILLPMLGALGAAFLAWHHAGKLDRQQSEGGARGADPGGHAWPLALAALLAALVATTMLQMAVLSHLAPR
jgi:hypothetical protein